MGHQKKAATSTVYLTLFLLNRQVKFIISNTELLVPAAWAFLSECYELNVHVIPKFICQILTVNVMLLGDKLLGSDYVMIVEPSWVWSVPYKPSPGSSCIPSAIWRHSNRMADYKWSGLSADTESVGDLTLNFSVSGTEINKCSLFKPPCLWYFC